MHILIGIGLAVLLLWAWLIGHWFARVLVFLLACAISIGLAAAITSATAGPPAAGVILALMFGGIGWFVAGVPTYYRRHKHRQIYVAAYQAELRKQHMLSQELPAWRSCTRQETSGLGQRISDLLRHVEVPERGSVSAERKRQLLSQELPTQRICHEAFVERPMPPTPPPEPEQPAWVPPEPTPRPAPSVLWVKATAWDREGIWTGVYVLALAAGLAIFCHLL